MGSAALAVTGIGVLGATAIGALMGGAQYALSCAFHGESLTLDGAITALLLGAVAGTISGADASNGKVLAKGMTGRAQTGMKALITTVNKYGINSSAYKNVMNLYGKAIAVSVQNTINKEFFWRSLFGVFYVLALGNLICGLKFIPFLVILVILVAVFIVYVIYWINPSILSSILCSPICGFISLGYAVITSIYLFVLQI